jgi:O-antigen ligase/Flp pilus assembly protein TadD
MAIIPGGEIRFVFAKVALTAAGVTLAASLPARGRLPHLVAGLLGASILVIIVASLASSEPPVAFLGRAPRFEGLPMLALYIGAGWAGARLLGPDPPVGLVTTMLRALCVVAVVICAIAVLETAGLRPLASDVARPGSLLGNASDEGALGVLLFGALGWAAISQFDWLMGIGALASGALVALSASRAALLGLVVTSLMLGVASPARRRLILGAAVVVLGLLTLALPATRSRISDASPLATATVTGRVQLWGETLALIGHHPVLGIGPDNYLDAITVEHNLKWQEEVGPANPPDSPHNVVFQASSDGGLLLLILVLGLSALTLRSGWHHVRSRRPDSWSVVPGLVGGLVGYGVALLFGFTTPGTTPLAAVFAGAILAVPLAIPSPQTRQASVAQWSAVVAGSVLTVLAVLAGIAEIPIEQGLSAVSQGNLQAAQQDFQTAHDLRPWDVSVSQIAGHAFIELALTLKGNESAAVARLARPWLSHVQPALRRNEEQATDEATLDELNGHFAAAQALLTTALNADPFNPALLLRLGVVQGESGHLGPAARTFRKVIRIDPSSPDPWSDLSILYRQEHETSAAAQAAATAKKLNHRG